MLCPTTPEMVVVLRTAREKEKRSGKVNRGSVLGRA
jgi:hypothetical protein